MTSTAISAQGSTLQVSTGTGSAKTVSAIAVGYPTILTSSAHGFNNGDVIALAAFGGADAATLNGQSATVKNVTANTWAIDIDTTGKTITAGSATATPTTYTKVVNMKTFDGFDGQASEIDVTNCDSTAKEFRLGLVDNGQIQIEFDQDNTDAGQAACLAARVASTSRNFKLTLPDSKVASFTAYVKQWKTSGGVDQVVKRQGVFRITGPVTWA